jgi:hypothetical protein
MGVMTCSRRDCNEIMCDTYIQEVGYICNDCKSDFHKYCEETGANPDNEHDIKEELKDFMKESKTEFVESRNKMTINEFFNNHTENNF